VPGYNWYGDQEDDNISDRTVRPDDSISRVGFSSGTTGKSNNQSGYRSSAGPHGGEDVKKRYLKLKSEVDAMKREAAQRDAELGKTHSRAARRLYGT
jgi:hypothetical protein